MRGYDIQIEIPVTIRARGGDSVSVPPALMRRLLGPVPPDRFQTNGMGPEKLGPGVVGRVLGAVVRWIVPERVLGWDLLPAAWFHDYAYHVGGTFHERFAADWDLAQNVVTCARYYDERRAGGGIAWRSFLAFLAGGLIACLLLVFGKHAFTFAEGAEKRGSPR